MGLARAEQVTVTDEVPAVDTASTTGGTSYEAEVILKLPIGTYYTDVVQLQPGVQQDNGDVQGRSLALSIYGSTSAENLFLIDGVNTTNVIKGIQGKAINYTFVEEVEVKTGGYQAEYGRNMGGVVNVVTRQGGNEFHGGALGLYGNASLRAERQREITPAYSQEGDVQASALNPKNDRVPDRRLAGRLRAQGPHLALRRLRQVQGGPDDDAAGGGPGRARSSPRPSTRTSTRGS